MTDNYENLRKHLSDLSLKTIAAIFETEAEKAAKTGLSYTVIVNENETLSSKV